MMSCYKISDYERLIKNKGSDLQFVKNAWELKKKTF